MSALYRRQLLLSVATLLVAAAGAALARIAHRSDSDVLSMGAGTLGLVAVATLLVASIRHAARVARYTFRGTREGQG